MNEMPEVKLFLGPVGDYALTGFPEFDEFATRNDPTWSAIRKRCFYSGVPEEVRMQLTAAELLKQNIELKKQLVKMSENASVVHYQFDAAHECGCPVASCEAGL